jgi:hypothetical protein
MEPWHRILIRGIFTVIIGIGFVWAGIALTAKLEQDKKWIGVGLLLLGAALLFYSLRYFGPFLHDLCCTM